jgi:hypothetical protein
MASTPAVGPRPTTRTNTSAHTSSGMLRNTISSQRTAWRSQNGPRAMRPDRAEMDSTRVLTSVSGMATTRASVTPAVAMATVRQVSRTTMRTNSASCASGQKLPRNCPVTFRLSGSSRIQGLNSVATPSGHSSTSMASIQKRRLCQAGSRRGTGGRLSCATPTYRQCMTTGCGARASADAGTGTSPRSSCSNWSYSAASRSRETARAGRSKAICPSRKPMMRGKCASATSTWCNVATSVAPRSPAPAPARRWPGGTASGPGPTRARQSAANSPRPHTQGARQADALALATREAVHPLKQFVAQIKAVQRLVGGGDVVRIEQRPHAGHSPMAGRRPASTAVTTRWRGGRGGTCGARNKRPRSRCSCPRGSCHGSCPSSAACRPTAATRRPAPATGWSCRRPTGR